MLGYAQIILMALFVVVGIWHLLQDDAWELLLVEAGLLVTNLAIEIIWVGWTWFALILAFAAGISGLFGWLGLQGERAGEID